MASSINGTEAITNPRAGDEEVTGQAAFWAIVALALNAMAQSSTTTDIFFGTKELFSSGLFPQLSSPLFCLSDAVIESVLLLVCAWRKLCSMLGWYCDVGQFTEIAPPLLSTRTGASVGELVGVRLVLFLFAVLPQTIKVLSMSGVPGLQALVVVLLASPFVRALTILVGDEYKRQERWLRDLTASAEDNLKAFTEPRPILRLRFAAFYLQPKVFRGVLTWLHLFAYGLCWYRIAVKLSLERTYWVGVAIEYLSLMALITYGIVGFIEFCWISALFFSVSWALRLPWPGRSTLRLAFLAALFIPSYLSLLTQSGEARSQENERLTEYLFHLIHITGPPLCLALIGSALIEMIVYHLLRSLGRASEFSDDGSSDVVGPGAASASPSSTIRTNAPQSFGVDEAATLRQRRDNNSPEMTGGHENITLREIPALQSSFGPAVHSNESEASSPIVEATTQPSGEHEIRPDGGDQDQAAQGSAAETAVAQAANKSKQDILKPETLAMNSDWVNESDPLIRMLGCGGMTVFAVLGVWLLSKPSSKVQSKGISNSYGLWVLVTINFSMFRQLIPKALLRAWKTGWKEENLNLPRRRRLWEFACILGITVALFLLQLLAFLIMTCSAFHDATPFKNMYMRATRHLEQRRAWNFLAIFNAVTAVAYFLIAFNGSGTVNPSWTDFLGRK